MAWLALRAYRRGRHGSASPGHNKHNRQTENSHSLTCGHMSVPFTKGKQPETKHERLQEALDTGAEGGYGQRDVCCWFWGAFQAAETFVSALGMCACHGFCGKRIWPAAYHRVPPPPKTCPLRLNDPWTPRHFTFPPALRVRHSVGLRFLYGALDRHWSALRVGCRCSAF